MLLFFTILGQVLDILTTFWGIKYMGGNEGAPFAKLMISTFGLVGGLFIVKGVFGTLLISMAYTKGSSKLKEMVMGISWILPISNIGQIIKALLE